MSLIHRFSQIIVLIAFTSCLPSIAASQDEQDEPVPAIKIVTVKIKIAECSMIVVPVTINGFGPYDFALDTGASSTMLDLKLAADLRLPRIGEKNLLGVQHSEIAYTLHADSISVAGATAPVQSLIVSDQVRNHPVKVRGVLGEDFLQNFDVLIDYRHQVIQLESGLGSLAQTLSGEHLPLQLSGILRGQPTPRRLIVSGHLKEFGEKSMSLILDSGTNYLVLFQESLGFDSKEQEAVGVGAIRTRTVRLLNIGNIAIPDLTVVVPYSHQEMDADGLVPTSLFHSLFISHQGRFVILNPSLPKGSH